MAEPAAQTSWGAAGHDAQSALLNTSSNGTRPFSNGAPPWDATWEPPYLDSLPDNFSLLGLHNTSELVNLNYEACREFPSMPFCNDSFAHMDQEVADDGYRFIIRIVVPIIFGLVVLVGLFGNTLVVIVIIANRQMRSTTNYLIFSLAVADLLFIVFCVPFTATDYILPAWPFGVVCCKVVQYLNYVTAYASCFTLLLLSIDRYFAVVYPIHAISVRTERNAVYAIVCTWTVILASCVPIYVAHGIKVDEWGSQQFEYCTFLTPEYSHAAFRIGFICTMFFIPVVVMVFLYVKILHRLWKRNRPGGPATAESLRSKKRVTQMVVIVVVTFVVCWFPIQMVLLLKSLHVYKMNAVGVIFQVGAQALAYTNSCLNPILYAFLSDPFRKAFRKVIYFSPRRRTDGLNHLDFAAVDDGGPPPTRLAKVLSFRKINKTKQSNSGAQSNNELSELKNTVFHKTTTSNNTDVSNLCEMVYCGPTTQLAGSPQLSDDQMRQLRLSERPLLSNSDTSPRLGVNNNSATMQRANGTFCAAQDPVHIPCGHSSDAVGISPEGSDTCSAQAASKEGLAKLPPAVPPRAARGLASHKSSDSLRCANQERSLLVKTEQRKSRHEASKSREPSLETAAHADDTPLLSRPEKTNGVS